MKAEYNACDNRDKILYTAMQLFSTRGYDAVGVQEIAMASGITKPTLYYYYGNKQGLLDAIMKTYGEPLMSSVRQSLSIQGLDLLETFYRFASVLFRFATENPTFYRMQLAMYFAPPESLPNQKVRPINEALFQYIESIFTHAAVRHPKIQGNELHLAATFLGLINTDIGLYLNGYSELDTNLVRDTIYRFIYGIL